jgi:hypothetical protein
VCPAVGYEEFGRVDNAQVFQRAVSDASDPFIDAGNVDSLSENPDDFKFGMVLQKIFCQGPWVAAILLEVI